MKFEPTPEELIEAVIHSDNAPSNLNNAKLRVSGSKWKDDHLEALRVVYLDDVDISRLFPAEYLPSESHEVFAFLLKLLTQATEDDLKEWNRTEIHSKLYSNKFTILFRNLAEAMTTRPVDILAATGLHAGSRSLSDLSSSSNEDKGEEPSKHIVLELVDAIISYPGYSRIASKGVDYDFTVLSEHREMEIPLGTIKVDAWNDGGMYITSQDPFTGSNRSGTVPLVSFEAKRRHAGNIRRHAGEEEPYSSKVLAQQVAEILGQAAGHVTELGEYKDQEAFVLSIHGTQIRLIVAHISAAYLRYLGTSTMPVTEHLYVRRSRAFDMKLQPGRAEALRLCIGLVEYMRSGKAEIGLLQKVFEVSSS